MQSTIFVRLITLGKHLGHLEQHLRLKHPGIIKEMQKEIKRNGLYFDVRRDRARCIDRV